VSLTNSKQNLFHNLLFIRTIGYTGTKISGFSFMKTAVITGGNSGIGKAVATALAKMDYRVIIHGKDVDKTKQAAHDITNETGNTHVEYITEDVSTIAGMKKLADAVKQKTSSIETLVLSTGVILPKQIITDDGLEAGFAIQYLSRFAVAQLLMPELEKGQAKIVVVVAPVIPGAQIYFDDIALKKNFTMFKALKQEMFANHLFVQEFAKRHSDRNVVINAANVGFSKTGILRHVHPLIRKIYSWFASSPEKSAKNFVFLASDESVHFSGLYLNRPGKPHIHKKLAYDDEIAKRLWEISSRLIEPVMTNREKTSPSIH
jgi:retinol dehydrogenase-12